MQKIYRLNLFFLCFLLHQTTEAAPLISSGNPRMLVPYTAEYIAHLKNIPLGGRATHTLTALGDQTFELRSEAKMLFNQQTEVSQFRWHTQDCANTPISYRYDRQYLGKRKNYRLDFSQDHRSVTYTEGKNKKNYATPAPIEDALTEQLAVSCQIKAGQSLISLNVAKKDKVSQHVFQRMGEESIKLPMGTYKTVRVKKQEAVDSAHQTVLWFAPELNYLLVQLQHTENGMTYTLQLKQWHSNS